MDAASTRLAVQSMLDQADGEDVDDAMVVTTMERHCGLMQSRKLLNQLEGPTGIFGPGVRIPGIYSGTILSVNKKLPTITPLLVPSNTVEDNGKSFIRSCGHYAFLSESVPAYDHKKERHRQCCDGEFTLIFPPSALKLADFPFHFQTVIKNKPDQLGRNGKHLLKSTNAVGKKAVDAVLRQKINNMRHEMRKLVHESIQGQRDLKTLVEEVLSGAGDMTVTWNFVRRVAIWRRAGTSDGCKDGNKWNDEFWKNVDDRLEMYHDDLRAGEEGDAERLALALDWIQDILDKDEEQFGPFERPTASSSCDIQNEYSDIYACCRSAAAEARLTCEDQLGERGDRVP
ncbi:hypothetical protein V8E36_002608 [Tilletia maclaganii]